MPTRKQVEDWKLGKLSEWAGEIEQDTQHYDSQLGLITNQFADVAWSGKAKDAAADRFTEERDQARRLGLEITDVVNALRAADTRLTIERQTLLNRVTDAEKDTESPLQLAVGDNWAISTKTAIANGKVPTDDVNKAKARITHHQGLINTAYYALTAAVSEVTAAITSASQEVRVRGDQLARGIDVAADDFSDSAQLGAEDGKALSEAIKPNGEIDEAALDRIASQLPTGMLSEKDLKTLADGGDVSTLPQSVQDYYKEFYKSAGKDGILALNERLLKQEEAGNPLAAGRRDALANGLLVVSNEKIGTGRNPDGTLKSAGTYENVPKSVRGLIETRFPLPDDADPSQPNYRAYRGTDESARLGEIASLSSLLGEASPGYQPGTKMGTELIQQSSYLMGDAKDDLKGTNYIGDVKASMEPTAARLVDIGGRNEESAYQILTGDGMPEDYDPQKVAGPLLSNDWSDIDKGRSTSQLLDWIGPDSQSADEQQADRAQAALKALPNVLVPLDDSNLPSGFGDMNENFVKNPELASALSKALQPNLTAFGDPNNADGFYSTHLEPQEGMPDRARFGVVDADRLLMLANASEEGRLGLQTALNLHQTEMITKALGGDPDHNANVGKHLGNLTGRIDTGMNNALLFQEGQKIISENERLQSTYEMKKGGAEIASELLAEAIPIKRGGPIGEMVGQMVIGKASEALIDQYIKEPELKSIPIKDWEALQTAGINNLKSRMLNAEWMATGNLPPGLVDQSGRPVGWTPELASSLETSATNLFVDRGLSPVVNNFGNAYASQLRDLWTSQAQIDAFLAGAMVPGAAK
ncbi:hypothetical protein [Nocardia sp. NPDC051832]|uniref:TPR repeat region-containing protein n=1 Tax=Nocardia sp. NPDC051832 TaxID=3155673 RepID=UPI0034404D5B